MTTRAFRLLLPAVLVLPVIAANVGGWAAITVEDLPDHLVARQPVPLTFTVRQHGVRPLDGLRAKVVATAGSLETSAAATAGRETGQYTAMLTLPRAGQWTITIHSGFGNSRVTLLPVTAIDSGAAPPPPLAESERGRRLFVAKGCVTCHVHRDVAATSVAVGPELTLRRYPPEFLKPFLASPTGQMPNLHLKPLEIAALTAFLNAGGAGAGQ